MRRSKNRVVSSAFKYLLMCLLTSGMAVTAIPAMQSKDSHPAISADPASIESSVSSATVSSIEQAFAGGSNSLVARAIGYVEGNRTLDGGYTSAYDGHRDPGNGAWNRGSFSVQQANLNPEEADEYWIRQLRQALPQYVSAMGRAGLNPGQLRLLLNYLDLYTQAPVAAVGRGGLLDQLPAIAAEQMTTEALLEARLRSFIDPKTGKLDAPGFSNNEVRLRADQKRRIEALDAAIQNDVSQHQTGKVNSEATLSSDSQGYHLRLVLTGKRDAYGALLMNLQYVSENGQVIDQVDAISGVPSRQYLRTASESQPDSYEPIPQGKFNLGKPEWNQNSWAENLGPLWIDVYDTGNRSAIGIHLDANRNADPGTAGCVGLLRPQDVDKVMNWWQDLGKEPQFLTVDYGLGGVTESSHD